MRPGQQNKRSRGRGGNNNGGRKNVNPLSRSYESNGPDIRVRGNPSHIAEKYIQLARDAQSTGDSVMAENYHQHAEHYLRIIAAAQAQNQARQDQHRRDRPDDQDDGSDNGADQDETATKAEPADNDRNDNREQEAVQSLGADVVVDDAANDDRAAAEKPKRAPRARRPRRKPSDTDLSDAPQPTLSVAEEAPKKAAPEKTAAAE